MGDMITNTLFITGINKNYMSGFRNINYQGVKKRCSLQQYVSSDSVAVIHLGLTFQTRLSVLPL